MDRAQHVRYKSANEELPGTQRPYALVMADLAGNKDKGNVTGIWIFIGTDVSWVVYNILDHDRSDLKEMKSYFPHFAKSMLKIGSPNCVLLVSRSLCCSSAAQAREVG